jgi:membrane protein DedA with SNARE-associated domain
MSFLAPTDAHTIGSFGYGAVAIAVGIESVGIPFPGETTLVAAAIYAGATHHLSILLVVIAAACGAIIVTVSDTCSAGNSDFACWCATVAMSD